MRYDFASTKFEPDEAHNLWRLAPATYLIDAVTRVERRGHSMTELLGSLGLSRASLEEPGKYVSSEQYYGIIAYCVNELHVPEVGFIQEDNVRLLSSGVAGLASLTSATVGDAIDIALRYQDLIAAPVELDFHRGDTTARLIFCRLQHEAQYPEPWHRVWAVETVLSSTYALLQSRGVEHQVHGIRLSYAEPTHRAIYYDTFDCPIAFDDEADELMFDVSILDVPQASSDPSVCALAKRQCERSVRKLASGANLIDQIEGIMLSAGQKHPSVGAIAERLHLSERTLQRRLDELGTGYREIANRLRHKLALELLRETDLSIKEIAYLLGYTESPNFSLAFKRLEGVSPANYRAT